MREDRDALKEVVSRLYRVAADDIGPEFSLEHPRFKGSAGRGLLAAAIKRHLGVYVRQAVTAATFAELQDAMFGSENDGAASAHDSARSGNGNVHEAARSPTGSEALRRSVPVPDLAVGVDIEMIENLPEVSDFWTSDFYRTHFTSTEIAYCSRQAEPRMHFAARWCAKEALAKCDPGFLHIDPSTVQITLDGDGRPMLDRIREDCTERLPYAVSVTHTAVLAAAVVVRTPARFNA
jgi:phosphopantetheine--protein transferase-like protein